MGRHRRHLTGGARYTVVRVTTAMGVAGALAIAMQQTHDSPVSRARPEGPHSARSATPPLAAPDARGPGRGAVGGSPVPVASHRPAATPPGTADVRSAASDLTNAPVPPETGPSATAVPLMPAFPDGTGGAWAAPSPGPGATGGTEEGDGAGDVAAPGTAGPASGAAQDTEGASSSPAPSPSPVRPLADLLHDLVTPDAGDTQSGTPRQPGPTASASAGQ